MDMSWCIICDRRCDESTVILQDEQIDNEIELNVINVFFFVISSTAQHSVEITMPTIRRNTIWGIRHNGPLAGCLHLPLSGLLLFIAVTHSELNLPVVYGSIPKFHRQTQLRSYKNALARITPSFIHHERLSTAPITTKAKIGTYTSKQSRSRLAHAKIKKEIVFFIIRFKKRPKGMSCYLKFAHKL